MHSPSWFEKNKAVLVTIVIAAATQGGALVYSMATLRGDMDDVQERVQERGAVIDDKFRSIANWQEAVDRQNLGWRLGEVEKRAAETNARLDRMADNILAGIEKLNNGVNGLDKRLDLLAQRVETALPPKRAMLMPTLRPAIAANPPMMRTP